MKPMQKTKKSEDLLKQYSN